MLAKMLASLKKQGNKGLLGPLVKVRVPPPAPFKRSEHSGLFVLYFVGFHLKTATLSVKKYLNQWKQMRGKTRQCEGKRANCEHFSGYFARENAREMHMKRPALFGPVFVVLDVLPEGCFED